MSNSLWLHGLQHSRLLCLPLSPRIYLNSWPLNQWCCLAISSSAALFSSCPQSFPASGSFPMNQLFVSGGQSIGDSASVLLMNVQDWFPLGLTGSKMRYQFSSVQSSCSVMSDSLRPHESQHARPPCPSPTPRVHSDLCPSSRWCHLAISSSSPSLPVPNPSQHQGLFQWVNSLHEVAKVLEFQLQHQSFQWTPRTDFL